MTKRPVRARGGRVSSDASPAIFVHGIGDNTEFSEEPKLNVIIDPGDAPVEAVQRVLRALSDLNIAQGGDGIAFNIDDILVRASEEATV